MNLNYDGLLTNVAFNCNLRHYITGGKWLSDWMGLAGALSATGMLCTLVGRCRLTPAFHS